ncbi:MAG TPA: hypothetical protein PKO06_22440, partial [Candidatus Ozemobacteraceae bacterium]|nr:hypothetical protein [Candidatus Ozemobacteraceae bacterium]
MHFDNRRHSLFAAVRSSLASIASHRRGSILFPILGFLLLILPFALTVLITRRIEREIHRQKYQEARQEVSSIVRRMAARTDPTTHFSELAERIVRAQKWNSSLEALLRGYPPEALEIMRFDAAGKRQGIPGLRLEKQTMTERALTLIRRLSAKTSGTLSKSDERLLDTLLGSHLTAHLLARQPNKLHDLFLFGTRRFSGLYTLGPSHASDGWILIQIHLDPLPRTFYADSTLNSLRATTLPKYQFGIIDLADHTKRHTAFERQLLLDRLSSVFRTGRKLVGLVSLPSGLRLYASREIPAREHPFQVACLFAGAVTGLFLLVCVRLYLVPDLLRSVTL